MGDLSNALAVLMQNGGLQKPQGAQGQPQPAQGGGGGDAMTQQIMQQLSTNMKGHTELAMPQMNPKMGHPSLGQDIGTSLVSQFIPMLGGALQRSIKHQKEQQITQVVNLMNGLHNDWEMAQSMSGGDPEKAKEMWAKMPSVQNLQNDKKLQKLFQKAFSFDPGNPEKTTSNVAFQGIKRFVDAKQAEGKMKQAKSMLDNFQQMQQQPQAGQGAQGQPQQQQGQPQAAQGGQASFADNLMGRLGQVPKQPSMADVKNAADVQKGIIETAMLGEPKTEFQAWYKGYKQDHEGKAPSSADVEAHHEASKLKPQDMLVSEAIDDLQSGEPGRMEEGRQKIELVYLIAQVTHPIGHKNFIDLISGANAGNPEDAKNLKTYMALQDEMRESYGRGRARYYYQPYTMADGTIRPMSGLDMFNYIQQHGNEPPPIPTGRLTSAQDISIQQLMKEAGPKGSSTYSTGALKGVYDNLAAFDNTKDRAVFANAWSKVEHSSDWLQTFKNVLTQVEIKNLSPEGQQLHVNLQRLAETMGRFRSSMGLPSTDQSMSLSLALLPGPSTPSSDVARMMLDNLNQMISQASVPALGGSPNKPQKEQTKEEKLQNLRKAILGK